jgi:hypothetical protein
VIPGAKVLVCGFGPDGAYVQHAIDGGANVTVIEHRQEEINRFNKLDAKLLRGSTSVIPAKDNSFDLAISYHYLHEIDPFFHSQVLSELGRVARRVAVIEPAPPADPLGKRIALLYSQAKRELGQFEYYQPLEYWKKLAYRASKPTFRSTSLPLRKYRRANISSIPCNCCSIRSKSKTRRANTWTNCARSQSVRMRSSCRRRATSWLARLPAICSCPASHRGFPRGNRCRPRPRPRRHRVGSHVLT